MRLLTLPPAIEAYFAADASNDTAQFEDCFTPVALVHDEEHEYRGLDEIKAWKQTSKVKYQYTSEPLSTSDDATGVRVHARLTGNFPGSPIEVDYIFTLNDGKIAELEIV